MGYPALANNNPANMSQDDSVAVQLPSRGHGNSRVAYLNRSIDQLIYDFMEGGENPRHDARHCPGSLHSRVVGYGLSDAETGLLASTNTLWPAAEISQAYAAIAAFQLVEQGSMEITDKVSRFVKDLPEAWKNVTVLQLLQHTSGIPDYRKSPSMMRRGIMIRRSFCPWSGWGPGIPLRNGRAAERHQFSSSFHGCGRCGRNAL